MPVYQSFGVVGSYAGVMYKSWVTHRTMDRSYRRRTGGSKPRLHKVIFGQSAFFQHFSGWLKTYKLCLLSWRYTEIHSCHDSFWWTMSFQLKLTQYDIYKLCDILVSLFVRLNHLEETYLIHIKWVLVRSSHDIIIKVPQLALSVWIDTNALWKYISDEPVPGNQLYPV